MGGDQVDCPACEGIVRELVDGVCALCDSTCRVSREAAAAWLLEREGRAASGMRRFDAKLVRVAVGGVDLTTLVGSSFDRIVLDDLVQQSLVTCPACVDLASCTVLSVPITGCMLCDGVGRVGQDEAASWLLENEGRRQGDPASYTAMEIAAQVGAAFGRVGQAVKVMGDVIQLAGSSITVSSDGSTLKDGSTIELVVDDEPITLTRVGAGFHAERRLVKPKVRGKVDSRPKFRPPPWVRDRGRRGR